MTDPSTSPAAPHERFAALYAEAAPALRAWAVLRCRGALGRALAPEDLEQEVCMEALRAIARYDPARGAFRPWIFGVANLVAATALRRLARGRLLPGEAMTISREQAVPAELTTVSRRVRRDEALQRLLDQISALPEEERLLLMYRGLEQLDHSEVGAILGIAPEAAAKRWQRLRARLQDFPAARDLLGEA